MNGNLTIAKEALKIQDFNGVWTVDLAIPVQRSNQLSYKGAIDQAISVSDSSMA